MKRFQYFLLIYSRKGEKESPTKAEEEERLRE